MVQPFVASVAHGEVSLVYFGGASPTPSASSPRRAISGAGHVRRHGARLTPAADELELATRALAATPAPTTYARVDLVRLPDGRRR
jgi:hypothetical protein